MKCWSVESGGTLPGRMLISRGEDTLSLSPPLEAQSLWSLSRGGAEAPTGFAHPVLSAWKAAEEAREAWGVVSSLEQAGSHQLDPRSHPPAGLGTAFSAPLPPGPSLGSSVAAAVGLRRERTGPNQLVSA